jgi:hypothetical protein
MSSAVSEPTATDEVALAGKRLLIFIVAYNAEKTIEKVLARIPSTLHHDNVEVLIIDDFSQDKTFEKSLRVQQGQSPCKSPLLRTPENQGYGGNQNSAIATRSTTGSISSLSSTVTGSTHPRNCRSCLHPCFTVKRMPSSGHA